MLPVFGDTNLKCQPSHFKELMGACLINQAWLFKCIKILSFTLCILPWAPIYPIWLTGDPFQISEIYEFLWSSTGWSVSDHHELSYLLAMRGIFLMSFDICTRLWFWRRVALLAINFLHISWDYDLSRTLTCAACLYYIDVQTTDCLHNCTPDQSHVLVLQIWYWQAA